MNDILKEQPGSLHQVLQTKARWIFFKYIHCENARYGGIFFTSDTVYKGVVALLTVPL